MTSNKCPYYDFEQKEIESKELMREKRFSGYHKEYICSHPENPYRARETINNQPKCKGNMDNCTYGLMG
jgi:hypothetical protein